MHACIASSDWPAAPRQTTGPRAVSARLLHDAQARQSSRKQHSWSKPEQVAAWRACPDIPELRDSATIRAKRCGQKHAARRLRTTSGSRDRKAARRRVRCSLCLLLDRAGGWKPAAVCACAGLRSVGFSHRHGRGMLVLELSLSALLVTAGAALLRQLLCAGVEHRRRVRKRTGGRSEAEVLQNVLEYVDTQFCSADVRNGEGVSRCGRGASLFLSTPSQGILR